MTTVDVGMGVRELTAEPGTGTVVAVYDTAAYVRGAGGLFALTSTAAPPGPIHLRCRTLPEATTSETVWLDEDAVAGAGWSAGLRAPTWRPTLPDPSAFGAVPDVPPAELLDGPLPDAWPDHGDVLAAGDLTRAAEVLGGRGAGLTPAGDDVLAGILLSAATLWGPTPSAADAAKAARTNDIAAAFLHWAARGQSIAPVHDLLHALACDDAAAARQALAALRSFGASSGSDLAYGLTLGLRYLPRAPPG